jgi:hypothetical protein
MLISYYKFIKEFLNIRNNNKGRININNSTLKDI